MIYYKIIEIESIFYIIYICISNKNKTLFLFHPFCLAAAIITSSDQFLSRFGKFYQTSKNISMLFLGYFGEVSWNIGQYSQSRRGWTSRRAQGTY